jgi:tyrosine-protein phosphatase SIW14
VPQEEEQMARMLSVVIGVALVGALIAGPIVFALHQQEQQRHFRVVRDGVLYRSGQMSVEGLRRAIHDYGIRTVIALRDARDGSKGDADRQEEAFCNKEDVQFIRLPPRGWADSPDGPAPVEENVRKYLQILRDPRNHPVLVHCFAGIHRTGAYCAIYRMEFERWTNAQALTEMKACGYDRLDEEEDILGFMERYQPAWKQGQR